MTAKAGGHAYFIRDDDVGELTDELKAFVSAFVARRIPVSYQIIPARFTQACADFLLGVERAHPDLIEFGQHGLRHEMMLKGKTLKREFGPERSFEAQRDDIVEGREILRRRLGSDRVIDQFTPPQHKFDRNTVRAAAEAGHRIFSAAAYASPHHRLAYAVGRRLGRGSVMHHGLSYHLGKRPEADLADVSISVAVDNGRAIKRRADALGAALSKAANCSSVVGLMFHHAVYSGAEGQAELTAIADRLAELGAQNFKLLSRCARSAPIDPLASRASIPSQRGRL